MASKVLTVFFIFFIVGCKSPSLRELYGNIELKQVSLVDENGVTDARCLVYKFQNGKWRLMRSDPLASCNAILGLSISDFEKLQQFLLRCDKEMDNK